ncbi:MAG: hypothetical protein IJW73_02690 [Candidatus Gastranaerophilales bacterium]|nr:hypothetical protein [Candidatus Gastranaerophilales bacterium]
MGFRVSQNSFSKGILSPSLQGRVELEQYSLGLKNLKNGLVLQEGCVVNRSGLEFLTEVKDSSSKVRLIPFVFDINESYVIEVGDKYFRFIKDGKYILDDNNSIYELPSPYSEDDIFSLDYVQQADVITFVHKNYKPMDLSRINHNNWELAEIQFIPSIEPPDNVKANYTGSTSANTTTYEYVVCAVDKNTNEESKRSEVVAVVGHLEGFWTTSEYITISWDKVDNALEYNIYRSVNGIFGYVGTSSGLSFRDNNIEPDLSSCAPLLFNPFEDENPSCVCYFQQRKVFASSNKQPQTFWATQTGSNKNFNISRPLNPTDSITMSMYDNVANVIQHLIPFDDLLVMTTNSEWAVNGADGIFCASPTPVSNLQSFYGSSKIKPVVSGSMVLFVQSGGNIVRDLGYDYLSDSYDGQELTLFANNLFESKKIVDMAYSKEPYRILWCVMDDGSLNALTYNPKQKISAWHTHSTKGNFESVTTIRENNEDIPYFVVKREINGKIVRYIERMKSRYTNSMENAFFLDCATSFKFSEEVDEILNLKHLANENVCALLNYGVVENLKVDKDGKVKLPYKAKNILLGLPYEFYLETLNLETPTTLGVKKIINRIEVKILNSREDFFIENDNETLTQSARCLESINDSSKLFNKNVEFCPLVNPSKEVSVRVIQKNPLPINILSITSTVSIQEQEQQ